MNQFRPQQYFPRDSRHVFNGLRFYAGTEIKDKKWYVFFWIVIAVMIIALIWMGERDRQHVIDKNALTDIVQTQAYIIDTMPCGELEMSLPIGRVES